MSKKKTKKAPARAAKKKAVKPKAVKKAPARRAAAPPSQRTAAATIFLYKTDSGPRVRTSPQLLGAGPGSIEWTVVNLMSDDPVDVEITWQSDSPWGGREPIVIKNGNYRRSMVGAKDGRYKYNVTAYGFTEDPEVEIPGI